jgi:hypothetical protein
VLNGASLAIDSRPSGVVRERVASRRNWRWAVVPSGDERAAADPSLDEAQAFLAKKKGRPLVQRSCRIINTFGHQVRLNQIKELHFPNKSDPKLTLSPAMPECVCLRAGQNPYRW